AVMQADSVERFLDVRRSRVARYDVCETAAGDGETGNAIAPLKESDYALRDRVPVVGRLRPDVKLIHLFAVRDLHVRGLRDREECDDAFRTRERVRDVDLGPALIDLPSA